MEAGKWPLCVDGVQNGNQGRHPLDFFPWEIAPTILRSLNAGSAACR